MHPTLKRFCYMHIEALGDLIDSMSDKRQLPFFISRFLWASSEMSKERCSVLDLVIAAPFTTWWVPSYVMYCSQMKLQFLLNLIDPTACRANELLSKTEMTAVNTLTFQQFKILDIPHVIQLNKHELRYVPRDLFY